MALVSKKTSQQFFSVYLMNEKFIECDPMTFNVILPLVGDFYYIGNTVENYNLMEYTRLKGYDILLSTAASPDFLFTFDEDTLVLVLSIERDYFYSHFKNLQVGFTKVEDNEIRNDLAILVASMADMQGVPNDEDRLVILDQIVALMNDMLIQAELPPETENNIFIASQIYELLRRPDTHDKNLQDIFEGFYFSRSYVSSKFKKITELGLLDYLRLRRVSLAYNNIRKAPSEITFLSGFRNEKIMKESLRLITGLSFKELYRRLESSSSDDDFLQSETFREFLHYAGSLQRNRMSTSSESESESEDVVHILERYDLRERFRPIWKNLGDFRLFRLSENLTSPDFVNTLLQDMDFDSYRMKVFYRSDNNYYLDLGNNSMLRLNALMLQNIFRGFARRAALIISIDMISLNVDKFTDMRQRDFEEYFENIFEDQNIFSFFNVFDRDDMQNISIEYSLGNLILSDDLERAVNKAAKLLRGMTRRVRKVMFFEYIPWGIHLTDVNYDNLDKVHTVLQMLSEQEDLLPDFLSLDVDEKSSVSGSGNVEHLLYSYERLVQRVSEFAVKLKRQWNLKTYITQFILYFNYGTLERNMWNAFLNSVIIQGINQSIKSIDGLGCISVSNEDKQLDFTLFSERGFANMLYHTIHLLKPFRGNVIYNKGCTVVVRNGETYYVLVYSDTKRSYFCAQKNKFLNYSWKNTLEFRRFPGNYKISHYTLDYFHGDFHSVLRNFAGRDFLSGEEWNYVERVSVPKLETTHVHTEDHLIIETEMKPFDVHVYKIERFR